MPPTDEDYFDYPAGQTTHVQFPMTMSERLLYMYLAGDARLYVDLKMYTLSRNGDKLQQDLCVYKTGQSHEVTICPD